MTGSNLVNKGHLVISLETFKGEITEFKNVSMDDFSAKHYF